jgi:hypothetical protein
MKKMMIISHIEHYFIDKTLEIEISIPEGEGKLQIEVNMLYTGGKIRNMLEEVKIIETILNN